MRERERGLILDKVKLYQKAMDTYGLENQTRMVFEEMAELQKELCKALRGFINTKNISEEIADVEIMLEQMKEYYKLYLMVEEIKTSKLNRLENNLEILNPRCHIDI